MRVESEKAPKKKKGRFWKILLILLLIAAVGFAGYKCVQHLQKKALLAANYDQATELLVQGKLAEAAELFAAAGDHMDAREQAGKLFYEQAEALLAEGKVTYAAIAFGKAGDYLDARERSFALWDRFADRDTLTDLNYRYDIAAVQPDGTVIRAADTTYDGEGYHPLIQRVFNTDPEAADAWTDIIAVDGWFALAGLKADGTVVTDHKNLDVSDWTDIVDVCIGSSYILGLRSDGTVVAEVGVDPYGQCAVEEWTDIIAICTDEYHTLGLRADGKVVATDIVVPATEAESAAYVDVGQDKVSGWRDIVAVRIDDTCSFGIKADGSLLMAGDGYYDDRVDGFSDIIDLEISEFVLLGLKKDGTVIYNDDWYPFAVTKQWTDVAAISGGYAHVAGVRADGSAVVAVSDIWPENDRGQKTACEWTVKVPTTPDFDLIASGFED